ncbi:UNVERIFIED_CONTAM: hypothetical protein PYX00_008220 [Menopon gallinae]|uniref:Tektin n=1 Tax=Menopon gallinae TaxID=328185 RepID=A0AAW2HMD7_9NEOP
MSLYFESLKPIEATPMKKWEENTLVYRGTMDARVDECMSVRNNSRRLRYETELTKSWDLYYNNMKLENRVYEIEKLILYAETMLPQIQTEKKLLDEEKFMVEQLLVNCDTWIEVCMTSMNILDRKLPKENTRDDQAILETKKEVALLEEEKKNLKEKCLTAWDMASRLEMMETRIGLNLEFKKEVLFTDKRCLAICKADTGVSYKVDPLKGPKKMLTIEEWAREVYNLVELSQQEITSSTKLREQMLRARANTITRYTVQFDVTDYEFRKRIYQINREKNECQYQIKRVWISVVVIG